MTEAKDLPKDLVKRAEGLLLQFPLDGWNPESLAMLRESPATKQGFGVACSGGADSVFSLLLLYSAFPKFRKKITALHFNHCLRGENSDKDALFVATLSKKLGLRYVCELAENTEKTDEATLRNSRMKFFRKVSEQIGFRLIIQGHHLNDIAETLLWRISRGVSIDGLINPKPVSNIGHLTFIRPFLTIRKSEICEVMKKSGLPWREDASNHENVYLRNRMRNLVVPAWENACDRDLLQGLSRTTTLIREDKEALDFHAKKAFLTCNTAEGLDLLSLEDFPRSTQKRILEIWLGHQSSERINEKSLPGKSRIILELLVLGEESSVQLQNGVWVCKEQHLLTIKRSKKSLPIPKCRLPLYTTIHLPNGGRVYSERLRHEDEIAAIIESKKVNQQEEALISETVAQEGLFVRSRNPGDIFQPMGAPGSKKLSDRMIDLKWDTSRKIETPVFFNHKDEVLWLPGFPPADFAKVNPQCNRVIRLTYQFTRT